VDLNTGVWTVTVQNNSDVAVLVTGATYFEFGGIEGEFIQGGTPGNTNDQELLASQNTALLAAHSGPVTLQVQGPPCCAQFDVYISGVDLNRNGTIQAGSGEVLVASAPQTDPDAVLLPYLVAFGVTTQWADTNNNGIVDIGDDFTCDEVTPGPSAQEGRITGGGYITDTVNGYGKVTFGYELHCDPGIVPNNLEVNWGGTGRGSKADPGQNFHLETLVSAQCFDNPSINQTPPPSAPFDTYVGIGTGTLNGVSGYTAVWTLVDAGEPGTSDTFTIKIYNPSGGLVLDASGTLGGGNNQTHTENKTATVTPPPLTTATVPQNAINEFNAQVAAATATTLAAKKKAKA